MPSHATLVPGSDATLHFVLCDFGKLGNAYIETDPNEADRRAVVRAMVSGEYGRPLKVIGVQPDGTWRDVSFEIAAEVDRTAEREGQTLAEGTQAFVMAHSDRQAPPANDLVAMMYEVARGVGNIR
jgi:hypothetical protein